MIGSQHIYCNYVTLNLKNIYIRPVDANSFDSHTSCIVQFKSILYQVHITAA